MTKYVIDLPKGVKFIVGKGYVMWSEKELLRIPVGNLQEYIAPTVAEDVPVEKRVIELPDDALNEFEALKQSKTLLGLLETVYDRGLQMSIPLVSDAAKQKVIGEYYSNHVEFVAKKEPSFYVVVELDNEQLYVQEWLDNNGRSGYAFDNAPNHRQQYLGAEADKLVAGLTALNARKVKVEE
ncbi:hypothetical protein [Weissella confusa]|uniref:hypothetical protein n=1 Tax=Weissella confusa TaxID=1583 RepID=UPI0018F111C8|nr:hypothetical protein [Weissella confusa]MBJ7650146.1 hypothetical protein [Weissella confusa]MBJ7662292.1 hypothetical protein [Weissella confusa]